MAPDEGLAFYYSAEDAPQLFLEEQPPGTSGPHAGSTGKIVYRLSVGYRKHPRICYRD